MMGCHCPGFEKKSLSYSTGVTLLSVDGPRTSTAPPCRLTWGAGPLGSPSRRRPEGIRKFVLNHLCLNTMGCLGCCRRACTGIAASLLVLLLAVLLGRSPEPDGILPNTAAAALAPIRRVNASSLDAEEFYKEHVLKGVPALITLDAKDAGPRDLLEQMLSNKCADRELKLLSTQQADVLAVLQDPKPPFVKWLAGALVAANILLVVLTGQTVDGWAARRTTTLSELSKADASRPYYGPSLGIRLLQLLESTTDNKLVRAASVLGSLIAQPVYLADKNQICPERLVDSLGETSFEKHVVRRLQKRGQVPWRNLTDVSFAGLRHEFHTKIFYGGPKSYSYPLHRDLVDGDILCVMHSGCKASWRCGEELLRLAFLWGWSGKGI
eukprot:s3_g53.t1